MMRIAKPGPQFVLERPSGPRRQAVTVRVWFGDGSPRPRMKRTPVVRPVRHLAITCPTASLSDFATRGRKRPMRGLSTQHRPMQARRSGYRGRELAGSGCRSCSGSSAASGPALPRAAAWRRSRGVSVRCALVGRLSRCFVRGRAEPERRPCKPNGSKADVDRLLHLALSACASAVPVPRTPPARMPLARRDGPAASSRLVRGFVLERVPEALQFENQGGALRSHSPAGIPDRRLRVASSKCGASSSASHGLTPSAHRRTARRLRVMALRAGCVGLAAGAWPVSLRRSAGRSRARTRAKISSHEPNAIALPS